jgi:1-acyl-sn-glycerol-3-phosphate acyltransferase
MHLHGPSLYGSVRWIIKTVLGFYFSRIERFHPERVPASGPVLFTSNHPNSSTDAFVIGTSVPRKVNFVGTIRLFALKLVAWLLSRCGVIPINRLKDDPPRDADRPRGQHPSPWRRHRGFCAPAEGWH